MAQDSPSEQIKITLTTIASVSMQANRDYNTLNLPDRTGFVRGPHPKNDDDSSAQPEP